MASTPGLQVERDDALDSAASIEEPGHEPFVGPDHAWDIWGVWKSVWSMWKPVLSSGKPACASLHATERANAIRRRHPAPGTGPVLEAEELIGASLTNAFDGILVARPEHSRRWFVRMLVTTVIGANNAPRSTLGERCALASVHLDTTTMLRVGLVSAIAMAARSPAPPPPTSTTSWEGVTSIPRNQVRRSARGHRAGRSFG